MPRHLMDDQDDITASNRHSVGIVENPLYTENEDIDFTPSFATLSAKQKKRDEAEVSKGLLIFATVVYITYSVLFDAE